MENDKILALIEQKSFAELSPVEREMVLSQMTESEYQAQHEMLLASTSLFDEEAELMAPNLAILADLQSRIQPKKESRNAAVWFTFQIPAYQSALAMAAMALIVWLIWPQPQTNYVEKEVIVYQPVHDTLEVIREIPVEKLVTIVKEVPVSIPVQAEYVEVSSGITPAAEPISADAISQNLANTSLAAERLSQFIVGVN